MAAQVQCSKSGKPPNFYLVETGWWYSSSLFLCK